MLGAQQQRRVEGAARDLVPVPGFEGTTPLRHALAYGCGKHMQARQAKPALVIWDDRPREGGH